MKKYFFLLAIISLISCSNASTQTKKEAAQSMKTEKAEAKEDADDDEKVAEAEDDGDENEAVLINFETGTVGKLPEGFTQTSTGRQQQTLNWAVADDNGNKVVAQLAKNKGDYYNVLVYDKDTYKDLEVSVKIKAAAGKEDQGGGLVWRYIDNNNYYITRYNPLEKNLRLYNVVNGNRIQIKSVESLNIPSGEWFTLTVKMKGNTITCELNDKELIKTTNDTFKSAGKIGLWTKADAQSYFDDLTIEVEK